MSNIVNAEKIHIGIFGLRNAGKSSIINSITGQNLAIVSDTPGTTTDPVKKAMELLPLGPVVIVDTPGLDDEGELGLLRVKKAKQVLNYIDLAIVVRDIERINLRKEEEIINTKCKLATKLNGSIVIKDIINLVTIKYKNDLIIDVKELDNKNNCIKFGRRTYNAKK